MSVYTKDIDQLLPDSIETSICKLTRHTDHNKQGKQYHTTSSLCEVYIPHTAAEETTREKELMNRENDREGKQTPACR